MKRGDIRWYTFQLPDKRRPVLILTRDEVARWTEARQALLAACGFSESD